MKKNFFGVLTGGNTAPFVVVSLVYFLLLGSPFICFLCLKGQPHTSNSVELPAYRNAGSMDAAGEGTAQLNKFDDETEADAATASIITKNVADWTKDADSRGFILLTRLAIFSVILAFGALGAAVSLITRTRNNELVPGNITIQEILSVQTIGAIFACILGLTFMGNLLSGTLFPNPSVFYRILYIPSAFAKLIVWSFIAGFSERFVPNVLNNLIKKADTEKTPV